MSNKKTSGKEDGKVRTNGATPVPGPSGVASSSLSGTTWNRRVFLGGAAASFTVGMSALPLITSNVLAKEAPVGAGPSSDSRLIAKDGKSSIPRLRAEQAYKVRSEAARRLKELPLPEHPTNGDFERYPNKIASFSKGLPHNKLGEVDLRAYEVMMHALETRNPADFELIPMGNFGKLVNPQAGLAFQMQGADTQSFSQPPAPAFSSAREAAEIAENYWEALTRDVPFSEYETNPITIRAAEDLSKLSDFPGPKVKGQVTPATLFRGAAPGNLTGPYISQFLWINTPFGAEKVERRMKTVLPGNDYMVSYADWLGMQSGNMPWPDQFDPVMRYIRNGRDLGQWVHYDVLFQAYFNALLILFSIGARRTRGNPYTSSRTQNAFGTYGNTHVASVLCGVSKPALQSVWYQKWFVHHRLRPETFAGRIHNHVTGAAKYPIHSDILNSRALTEVHTKNGTYLLPQAFPEGAPTHPSYGAGHATVAGACVTVLKAFFDESFVIRGAKVASPDGNTLMPYKGDELTVGGELNKLAYNIAMGRNIAGVHWHSDAVESLKLGEQVAIHYLREERDCLNEKFDGFSFTKFDGTPITI